MHHGAARLVALLARVLLDVMNEGIVGHPDFEAWRPRDGAAATGISAQVRGPDWQRLPDLMNCELQGNRSLLDWLGGAGALQMAGDGAVWKSLTYRYNELKRTSRLSLVREIVDEVQLDVKIPMSRDWIVELNVDQEASRWKVRPRARRLGRSVRCEMDRRHHN